jgi:hypothetical protein
MKKQSNRGRPPNQRNAAEVFICNVLKDGELSALEVFDKAEQQGISIRTLKRAKARLGVISMKETHVWYWVL